MRPLGPTPIPRLNEAGGLVLLFAAAFLSLSLVSYHPTDSSWNTATGAAAPANLTGSIGSHVADLLLQGFGLASFLLPFFILLVGWYWLRSREIERQFIRLAGAVMLAPSLGAALALIPGWRLFGGAIAPGGVVGMLLAESLVSVLNLAGTILILGLVLLLSVYLITSFSIRGLPDAMEALRSRRPAIGHLWDGLRARQREKLRERESGVEARARARAERMQHWPAEECPFEPDETAPARTEHEYAPVETGAAEPDIPIRTLEDLSESSLPDPETVGETETPHTSSEPRWQEPHSPPAVSPQMEFRLPPTALLNEAPARNPYDEQELKELAGAIKSKFQEFNVLGSVVQINHGPVVTTYEFKPEAGIKYSRITTLTDDLCLGLQAESILIERIPGKPTVGIEVPNSKRELISLRQMLESEEFRHSKARLPIPLGKDINGRIKVISLESMPHALIAGSTGSGKSVMLNAILMSMLYRLPPNELRMVLVDPKQVELGMYEGIPHLLTPVITDPKKASNALRNAVTEMERRLKLLASQGVRNIEQFNQKVHKLWGEPRSLFPDSEEEMEDLAPLPYILVVIDELSDLMMAERANVEYAVTRLAQMARAVGMHLVLATQRPSVDVITGLIKANFPARISFRVATRVDSRTILDVMGAEHLLGKGDMLFLPPGSSRLIRVHGAFVTENEINQVVEFWKEQASPDYDESYLLTPPDDDDAGDLDDVDNDDPAYTDAVRVVLEMGKASTSILQRRLRLGYGRAARLLDMMQKEGIIGPPDGSRPREVLKSPDWLREVEEQLR